MAILAALLVAQKGFIEELQSQIIKLSNGGAIYGGDKYLKNGEIDAQAPANAKGFWLGANGEAKLEEAMVSGHIDATSGTFHGRIEANEGFFIGELTAGPFNANTQPLFSVQQNYASGTSRTNIVDSIFAFWGKSTGAYAQSVYKPVQGTYGIKSVTHIYVYDQGRASVADLGGITLYFADGTNSGLIQTNITSNLSFKYKTESWTVAISNIPDENPRIAGVLYRNGNQLMISAG